MREYECFEMDFRVYLMMYVYDCIVYQNVSFFTVVSTFICGLLRCLSEFLFLIYLEVKSNMNEFFVKDVPTITIVLHDLFSCCRSFCLHEEITYSILTARI